MTTIPSSETLKVVSDLQKPFFFGDARLVRRKTYLEVAVRVYISIVEMEPQSSELIVLLCVVFS